MPELALPLTDLQVRNAKPKDKADTLPDGGGMYREVTCCRRREIDPGADS